MYSYSHFPSIETLKLRRNFMDENINGFEYSSEDGSSHSCGQIEVSSVSESSPCIADSSFSTRSEQLPSADMEHHPVDSILETSVQTSNDCNSTAMTMIAEAFSINEHLPDLEIEFGPPDPTKDSNANKLEGRRIVDIKHFMHQVRSLERHKCKRSTRGAFLLQRECKIGFYSSFVFECRECGETRTVTTDPIKITNAGNNLTINDYVVWGVMSIGGGHANIDEVFSVVGVPVMAAKTFTKMEQKIGEKWEQILYEEMLAAGKEETRIAKEAGNVHQGVPFITVIVDGGWSHRSHGHRYTANSGVAVIIGKETKKILYMGVRNKYCSACEFEKRQNKPTNSNGHKCYRNWTGPSASMESDILVEGFRQSETMHGLQYRKFIGDGDSSVYKNIMDKVPYGTEVSKILCANHAVKCLTTHLYKHASTSAEYKRCLNPYRIRRMTKAARGAICHAAKNQENAMDLRADLLNVPKHVFGSHAHCRSYFCDNPDDQNIIDTIPRDLYIKIMSAINSLAAKSDRLITDDTSNRAENYMSLVAKFSGGKQVDRGKKGSYQIRCHGAGLNQHLGRKWHAHAIRKITHKSPNVFLKKHILSNEKRLKIKKRCLEKEIDNMENRDKKRRKIAREIANGKRDYLPEAEQPCPATIIPDIDAVELEKRQYELIKSLKVDHHMQSEIEKKTKGQASNEEWIQQRKRRLTASNFGLICKRRETTKCHNLVKYLLYTPLFSTTAMEYGKANEAVAIAQYERETGTKVNDSGIFVDLHHCFLAASPDGLINSDGLVEVKCPKTIEKISPLEATDNVKGFCCQKVNGKLVLRKTHNYFYQVQGQLHITNRNYCDFVVWSPNGISVERIMKDDSFWNQKMFPFLERFYLECLLPEIVDSRNLRNMDIREPKYITDAIEKLEKRKNKNNKPPETD